MICLIVGSALGGSARYFVAGAIARRWGEIFPWGTLMVNVSGAFLIGIFGALSSQDNSWLAAPDLWLLTVTGFLGCYTTVSSFSLQTLALVRDGERVMALGNFVLSVGLSLAAVACGFLLADSLGGMR